MWLEPTNTNLTIKKCLKHIIHVKQWQPLGMTNRLKKFRDIVHFFFTLRLMVTSVRSGGQSMVLEANVTLLNTRVLHP